MLSLLGMSMTAIPANMPATLVAFTMTVSIVMAALSVLVSGLYGWFALQYARQIKLCMDSLSPQRFEDAMQWQRRYWTLQGVALIVGIALAIVMVVGIIVLSVMAAQQGGLRP
ncbi:MAG: hypothetical protein L0H54_13875 [Alcaligenaceae bacterium]|nr:hypothetical protein [Alcaligenaceae bacterium]